MNYEEKQRLIALRDNMKSYGYMDGVEELESIFPELAESEDERIRKEILAFVIDMDCQESWIHYLEKQKEPNAKSPSSFGDEATIAYHFGLDEGARREREKQKEQKPVDGITQDEIEQAMKTLTDFKVFATKEAKQYNISHRRDIDWHNFCASLLTYLEVNKPVEWSEEDDACYETIKGIIEDNLTEEDKPEYVLSWFKLHYFRHSWKPSEEQMEALCKASDLLVSDLNSLYNDLKKLM